MAPGSPSLTTPDLVLLSLLAERPMHGYEVNAELERRQARDWVAISRPQIYYSLEKLTRQDLLDEIEGGEPALGAERRVLATSTKGRSALTQALEGEDWTTQRDRPAFLTWLALSWQAGADVVRRQLRCRRLFLESEITRERSTLKAVRKEVGHPYHEAVWMLGLTIAQLELELRWLAKVESELQHRAPARRPGVQSHTMTRKVVPGPRKKKSTV